MWNLVAMYSSTLFVFQWVIFCIHFKLILYKIYKRFQETNKNTSFNLTFRHIHVDDVLSLNNHNRFKSNIDVIYPDKLEIKDTTDAPKWTNYLHLEFDEDSKLYTRLSDKRDLPSSQTVTGFQLFCVDRDGCHMRDRKCTLFPEHLITQMWSISHAHSCGTPDFTPLGEFIKSPIHYSLNSFCIIIHECISLKVPLMVLEMKH